MARGWHCVHLRSGDVWGRYVLGPFPLSYRLVEALPPRPYLLLRGLRLIRLQERH